MLLFSIPFDKGWTAKVDGAAVPLERVDIGFMGLVLEKGEHRVELEYRVPSLIYSGRRCQEYL